MMDDAAPLLEVTDLHVLHHRAGGSVALVDGISFQIGRGEIFGLVGESGSGKSISALATVRLLADGISIIAAIRAHIPLGKAAARARAIELLREVGIPDPANRLGFYPHQLSGGMCQRVMIAMALAGGARLVIADEPTTALDVTIQAEIVKLLERLVRQTGIGLLFISHDLGLVARLCDRLAVAYAGEIVETGKTATLLRAPMHPYMQGLVKCVADFDDIGVLRGGIPGTPPMPGAWPDGCRFQARCEFAIAGCERRQELCDIAHGHQVRCWRAGTL
jgi:oligopeptide/dipeptide ABC transporter ATP-binding protein